MFSALYDIVVRVCITLGNIIFFCMLLMFSIILFVNFEFIIKITIPLLILCFEYDYKYIYYLNNITI